MKNKATAQRYAQALFELANEKNILETVFEELSSIRGLITNSKEFFEFLNNPIVPDAQKIQTMKALFEGKVKKETMDFLTLVCIKDRENILDEMIDCFVELRNEKLGLVTAEVLSVVDFSDAQVKQLTEKIKTMTGKTPTLTFKKDASLIGGFTVRIGDTVLDGSVRRQIERLRNTLLN